MNRKLMLFFCVFFLTGYAMAQKERIVTFCFELKGEIPYSTNVRIADVCLKVNNEFLFNETLVTTSALKQMTYSFEETSLINLSLKTYRGYVCEISNGKEILNKIDKKKVCELEDTVRVIFEVDKANKYQYLYYSLDKKTNKPYRIPALAQSFDGTLIAVSDHRPCWSDIGYGEVDIKVRTSKDYKNWSEEIFVANGNGGNENVFECGFGDAAIVADRESNEVLMMCVAGRQVFHMATKDKHNFMARIRSNDGGKSWSKPEDVTSMFMNVEGNYKPILPHTYSMFFASGRIVQSKIFKAKDSKYYRLYASLLTNSAKGKDNYVVYSDDFGESWHLLGGVCVKNGDEAKVEELSNGDIVISSRKPNGRFFNVFSFSDIANAKGSWAEEVVSHEVKGGISVGGSSCNGELLKVRCVSVKSGKECEVLLQSLPTGDNRTNVTIFFKELEENKNYTPTSLAENWTKGFEVSDRLSAYSTMILQQDGKIGFLYEEEPNDYSIVYVALSIEEITNGEYKSLNKNE